MDRQQSTSARKLGISPVTGHRREKAKVTGRKGEKVRGRWTRRQSTSARKLGISPVTRHRREKVKMTGRKGKKVRGRWTDGRGRRGYGGHVAGESAATIVALAFAFPIESPPRIVNLHLVTTRRFLSKNLLAATISKL